MCGLTISGLISKLGFKEIAREVGISEVDGKKYNALTFALELGLFLEKEDLQNESTISNTCNPLQGD